LESLASGHGAEDLVLDISGRIQEHFVLTEIDDTLWLDTEPGHGESLLDYLSKMVFWTKVEPTAADDFAVLSLLGPAALDPSIELAELIPVPAEPYRSVALEGGGVVRRMPWPGGGSLDLVV